MAESPKSSMASEIHPGGEIALSYVEIILKKIKFRWCLHEKHKSSLGRARAIHKIRPKKSAGSPGQIDC